MRGGWGCGVWDRDGRESLARIAGIAVSSLGHAHPGLIEAVTRQVAQVAHTSNLFLHEREIDLAERLLGLLCSPGGQAMPALPPAPAVTGPPHSHHRPGFISNSRPA